MYGFRGRERKQNQRPTKLRRNRRLIVVSNQTGSSAEPSNQLGPMKEKGQSGKRVGRKTKLVPKVATCQDLIRIRNEEIRQQRESALIMIWQKKYIYQQQKTGQKVTREWRGN